LIKKSEIYKPEVIRKILTTYRLSLKKRFGQNFLIDKNIANYIVSLLNLDPNDRVIEIGPGLGAITLLLAEKSKQVVTFEIDRGVCRVLKDILRVFDIKNVTLINEDFLKLSDRSRSTISGYNKMVSNFPYSSGQKMVIKAVEKLPQIKRIVGTLQREVAERFVATRGSKNYGFISVWVQFLSDIDVRRIISPGSFYPRPVVESSVVEITPKLPESMELENIKKFIKCCFSNKRKSLVNNIVSCKDVQLDYGKFRKEVLLKKIKELFGDENIRAEQLMIKDFKKMYEYLYGGCQPSK